MSTMVKVKACADCLYFSADRHNDDQLSAARMREISEGFSRWEEYEFTLGGCSEKDLMNDAVCGICHNSLTKDRRRRDERNVAWDRRALRDKDRRALSEDRRRHNDNILSMDRRSAMDADPRTQLEDRRRRDENSVARDRRSQPDGDRRTPFNRGSRVLLATLRIG
jgi:hypothetical protein